MGHIIALQGAMAAEELSRLPPGMRELLSGAEGWRAPDRERKQEAEGMTELLREARTMMRREATGQKPPAYHTQGRGDWALLLLAILWIAAVLGLLCRLAILR